MGGFRDVLNHFGIKAAYVIAAYALQQLVAAAARGLQQKQAAQQRRTPPPQGRFHAGLATDWLRRWATRPSSPPTFCLVLPPCMHGSQVLALELMARCGIMHTYPAARCAPCATSMRLPWKWTLGPTLCAHVACVQLQNAMTSSSRASRLQSTRSSTIPIKSTRQPTPGETHAAAALAPDACLRCRINMPHAGCHMPGAYTVAHCSMAVCTHGLYVCVMWVDRRHATGHATLPPQLQLLGLAATVTMPSTQFSLGSSSASALVAGG